MTFALLTSCAYLRTASHTVHLILVFIFLFFGGFHFRCWPVVGFLPVPGKMVTNIISGQYIDLATLLAKLSGMQSPSPLIYIDGQVVVSQASKPARHLTDISQWLQAFAIYMLIMVTYLPSRAADLICYQLLILRMYTQFSGLAWYNYDKAFHRDTAARHVVDWSGMHVELHDFHSSALTRVLQPSLAPLSCKSIGA